MTPTTPVTPVTPVVDHLQHWLTVRDTVPWHETRATGLPDVPLTPIRDGAAHDIRTHDHARDPRRATRLLTALTQARADAACAAPLDFKRLSAWQQHVLGVPDAPPLRRAPAFAKAGRERYGTAPDLRERLDACLAQSTDGPALPLPARAARAYLDVCFFHPFADGNARSAFLTLTFVLARAGIALDQVAPIRRLPRHADDPEGALALADLVSALVTTTVRRAARHTAPHDPRASLALT